MAPAQQASVPNASIDTKHEDMIVSGKPAGARCGAPPMRAGGCPPARLTGAQGGASPAGSPRTRTASEMWVQTLPQREPQ